MFANKANSENETERRLDAQVILIETMAIPCFHSFSLFHSHLYLHILNGKWINMLKSWHHFLRKMRTIEIGDGQKFYYKQLHVITLFPSYCFHLLLTIVSDSLISIVHKIILDYKGNRYELWLFAHMSVFYFSGITGNKSTQWLKKAKDKWKSSICTQL